MTVVLPTQDEVKRRFPVGDRIEYQSPAGMFSGIILGYVVDERGISLDLGDRIFPLRDEKYYKLAEKYHKPACSASEEPDQSETVLSKKVKNKIRTTGLALKLE